MKQDNKQVNNQQPATSEQDVRFDFFPFKKRYHKHYRHNKIHLFADLVLVGIIVILLAAILNVYYFSKTRLNNLIDFQVVSLPEQLINGQPAEFTINYTNTTDDILTDAILILKLPKSLHQTEFSLEQYDTETSMLNIGDLQPHEQGQIKINGLVLGDLETKHKFLALINYKNKYSQDKQEFFNQGFELNGSALQAEILLPAKVIASGPFTTQVNITNSSDIDFEKLKIKMAWPQDYVFNQTDLEPQLETDLWLINNFTSQQQGLYNFTGRAYIEQPQNQTWQALFYATYQGQEFLLAKTSNSTFVDFSRFKINLTNLGNIQSINPGQQKNYTLSYHNEEDYEVNNVELGFVINGDYATQQKVNIAENIKSILPNNSNTIELPINAKTKIDLSNLKDNYELEVRAYASYDDPIEKSRITVESQPVYTKVSSKLFINTSGLFFTDQGDQIGVGSVPPVIGEYTSYWIIIKIMNAHNPAKEISVTAQIPDGVQYTDIYNVTEGSQIIHHENSNTLEWRITELESFTGFNSPAPQARIQLAIIPLPGQAGQSPALLTDIKATATDKKTNEFLTTTGKTISTAIFNDESLNKVID